MFYSQRILFSFLSFIVISFSYSQKVKEFSNTKEYLEYVGKEFKIPSTEIFYFSTESDSINKKLEKFGILLFVTDNKISTVQEVADELKSQCSPRHLLPKLTNDAIIKVSSPSDYFDKIIVKNLQDGKKISRENKKLAIYIFSYRFGSNAKLFYNERKDLEKLGYKTIVLSIDGAYIKELEDIDKTPVYVQ